MARFCPECAHPILEQNQPFCPACGARLPPSPGEVRTATGETNGLLRPEPVIAGPARNKPSPLAVPARDVQPFHYSWLFWAIIILDICISFFFGLVSAIIHLNIFSSGSTGWSYGGVFLLCLLVLNFILDILLLAREHVSPKTIDRRLCMYKSIAGILGVLTVIAGLYFLIISITLYRSGRKQTPDSVKPSFVFQKVCKGCGALIPAGSSELCASCESKNAPRTQPAIPVPEVTIPAAPPAVPDRSPEPVPEKNPHTVVPVPAGEISPRPAGVADPAPNSSGSPGTIAAGRTGPEVAGGFPDQMTCRACGTSFTPGERYCRRCLVLLPDFSPRANTPDVPPPPPAPARPVTPGTCHACGNSLKPGDVYCDKCLVLIPPEARIKKPEPPPEPPHPYDLMNSRERRRYYLIEAGVIAVLLAGILLFMAGAGIAGLNRTGIMPTFPFAGYLTGFIGSLVIGLSIAIEKIYTGRLYAEVEQRIIEEMRFRKRS